MAREKKVQVTFWYQGGNWTIHVPAANAQLAIVEACRKFVLEGFELDEITTVKTERSDSYL